MKLPKWVRKPQSVVTHSHAAYMAAAKLLEIEAHFCRKVGNNDGARALIRAAASFRQIGGHAAAPDVAFGWPEEAGTPGVGASEPPGYKLMPLEPTMEQLQAIARAAELEQSDPEDHRYDDGTDAASVIYSKLLAATDGVRAVDGGQS